LKQSESKTTAKFQRVDPNLQRLSNEFDIDVALFANERVPVEQTAVDELQQMLQLQATVEAFQKASPAAFPQQPQIHSVALTPDFHKARGIPVGTILETSGFVAPQAIGNDINCGMRVHVTDLDAEHFLRRRDELEVACRSMFFEAGRSIPMQSDQREALLLNGIEGLAQTVPASFSEGLWAYFHRSNPTTAVERIERRGSLPARSIAGLEAFRGEPGRMSRDSQTGSIGGGNHFVEFQQVKRIIDGQVAHAWGLKPGMVTVMVHTGSVSIGHASGSFYRDKVRDIFPASLQHPENGLFILPLGGQHAETAGAFWDSLNNAANFAYANRMFLAMMAWASLESCLGETQFELLYDAPHNMVWREMKQGQERIIHRKGACPARGFAEMTGTPFAYYGEPVLVPGSMGASSFILAGNGFSGSNMSAAHGAGRSASRGSAMRGYEKEFAEFLENFRVVTPVDFRRQDIKRRRDIIDKKLADLKQEAPFAYKGIGPVIETLEDAGIARPVAELSPLMTIKG